MTYDIANSVYRRFGEAGERLVVAFLETATPSQLAVLFQEFGSRVAGEFLCVRSVGVILIIDGDCNVGYVCTAIFNPYCAAYEHAGWRITLVQP